MHGVPRDRSVADGKVEFVARLDLPMVEEWQRQGARSEELRAEQAKASARAAARRHMPIMTAPVRR